MSTSMPPDVPATAMPEPATDSPPTASADPPGLLKRFVRWWRPDRPRSGIVVVGNSRAGKTSLITCLQLMLLSDSTNAFGQRPPALPGNPRIDGDVQRIVESTKDDRVLLTCTVELSGRRTPLTIYDFRGGLIEDYNKKLLDPKMRALLDEALDCCDLLVLVIPTESLHDEHQAANLVNHYCDYVDKVEMAARDSGRPLPMIAIAFTKVDDYGTLVTERARLVEGADPIAARLKLSANDDASWNPFVNLLTKNETTALLLKRTRRLWEQAGPRFRFFNAYLVAAMPENADWEAWQRRGVGELFADFFARLQLIHSVWPRIVRFGVLAIFSCACLFLCLMLNQFRAARDIEVVRGVLGVGVVNATSEFSLDRYNDSACKQIDRSSPNFCIDQVARHLVLLQVEYSYLKTEHLLKDPGLLKLDKLPRFDEGLKTSREQASAKDDPVALIALQNLQNDSDMVMALAKSLIAFNERKKTMERLGRNEATEKGQLYLDELKDLVQTIADRKEKGLAGKSVRVGLRTFGEEVDSAVEQALKKVLENTFYPAFVKTLRDLPADDKYKPLLKRFNPYSRTGLTNLQQTVSESGQLELPNTPVETSGAQVVLLLTRQVGGKKDIYRVDFWNRSVSINERQPMSFVETRSVPCDTDVAELLVTLPSDSTAMPVKVLCLSLPDKLWLPAVVSGMKKKTPATERILLLKPERELSLTRVTQLSEAVTNCFQKLKFARNALDDPFHEIDNEARSLSSWLTEKVKSLEDKLTVKEQSFVDAMQFRRDLIRVQVDRVLHDPQLKTQGEAERTELLEHWKEWNAAATKLNLALTNPELRKDHATFLKFIPVNPDKPEWLREDITSELLRRSLWQWLLDQKDKAPDRYIKVQHLRFLTLEDIENQMTNSEVGEIFSKAGQEQHEMYKRLVARIREVKMFENTPPAIVPHRSWMLQTTAARWVGIVPEYERPTKK